MQNRPDLISPGFGGVYLKSARLCTFAEAKNFFVRPLLIPAAHEFVRD
jgi:hypothetical protein